MGKIINYTFDVTSIIIGLKFNSIFCSTIIFKRNLHYNHIHHIHIMEVSWHVRIHILPFFICNPLPVILFLPFIYNLLSICGLGHMSPTHKDHNALQEGLSNKHVYNGDGSFLSYVNAMTSIVMNIINFHNKYTKI